MENREVAIEWFSMLKEKFVKTEYEGYLDMAISALEKQEQSCDTCRHGRFGDRQCDNCGVRYPNHYEAEEDND